MNSTVKLHGFEEMVVVSDPLVCISICQAIRTTYPSMSCSQVHAPRFASDSPSTSSSTGRHCGILGPLRWGIHVSL